MMIDDELLVMCLIAAKEAKRDFENDPTDETQEAYDEARGAFRCAVIDEMRDQMDGALIAYLRAAEDVKAAYEVISGADRWFANNGLKSGLPNTFLKAINLPNPDGISRSNLCGTEQPMRVPFADYLTADAEAMFEGRYYYHDDHAREEKEAPMDMKNYPKEFNAGLGR